MVRKIKMPRTAPTTTPGFINQNGQMVVRDTGFGSETFPGQRVYQLRCGKCGNEYGCQGGAAGEKLRERGLSLFDGLDAAEI